MSPLLEEFMEVETRTLEIRDRAHSPSHPLKVPHSIEVPILGHERQTVLAPESGDPKIVGRNGVARFPQFIADLSVMARGLLIDCQDPGCGNQLREPLFIFAVAPRSPASEAIFPKCDHWQLDTCRLAEDANRCWFIVGDCGKSAGIEDHSQSSRSILSNSLLMIALMRVVSL
jgi:hypothetical protein